METLRGIGGGKLTLTGNSEANTLIANTAGDRLVGGAGADQLFGGAGNDTFVFDGADTIVDVAGGFDTVQTAFNFTASVGIESVVATGTGAITLRGSAQADQLTGNAAANSLVGNAGNDRLAGKAGKDTLRGGVGKDTFVFDTKLSKTTNLDRVIDFSVKDDTIALDNAIMKALGKAGRLSSDAFVKSATALDRDDRVLYDAKSGALFYDADGTGAAAKIQIAILSKNLKMTSADFLVI